MQIYVTKTSVYFLRKSQKSTNFSNNAEFLSNVERIIIKKRYPFPIQHYGIYIFIIIKSFLNRWDMSEVRECKMDSHLQYMEFRF